jgi:hypothetical protein
MSSYCDSMDGPVVVAPRAGESVADPREYVEATIGRQVCAHGFPWQPITDPHAHLSAHGHD